MTAIPEEGRAMPQAARATGPAELWLPIGGYEALYSVSSHGRVRSEATGELRALVPQSGGYLSVRLANRGVQTRYLVHRLVCEAFHGPGDVTRQVAHLDGNPANNRSDNLIWATPKENHAHKARHGTRQTGSRNGNAKFNDVVAATVRVMAQDGFSQRRIAELTGVSKTQVHRIICGEVWSA